MGSAKGAEEREAVEGGAWRSIQMRTREQKRRRAKGIRGVSRINDALQ